MKLRGAYGLSITETDLRVIGMEMTFQVAIMRNVSQGHEKQPA